MFVGLPPDQVALASPAGQRWLDAYVARFGAKPDAFGAYEMRSPPLPLPPLMPPWLPVMSTDGPSETGSLRPKTIMGCWVKPGHSTCNGDTSITTISHDS